MPMKLDKARELFSDYYEGTLDPGLRQAFEAVLRNDAIAKSEYESFAEMMGELNILAARPIEPPTFLSDRIATRLELAAEKRTRSLWSPMRWLKLTGAVAASIAIIAGGYLGLTNRNGRASEANVIPVAFEVPGLHVVGMMGKVTVEFLPTGRQTVSISTTDGKKLKEVEVEGRSLVFPLENPNTSSVVFKLDVSGEKTPLYVVVPGSSSSMRVNGTGNVAEFAKAVADRYHIPVSLQSSNLSRSLSWNLDGAISDSVRQTLNGQGFVVEQHRDDLLQITDH